MPTLSNYMSFLYVNLGFILLIVAMMYFKNVSEIKANWPKYRCNPPYWMFSDDISKDFAYCVQNTQMNITGYMLQPITSLISSLTTMGGEFSENLNGIRTMMSGIRDFVSSIVEKIFGVFLNLVIEFQRMMLSMKDMMGKTIAIVVTLLYVLDGSLKTMNSAWKGPPGQMVQAIGSCFHPDTQLRLLDGRVVAMKDIPLGARLEGIDGARVFSVMRIDNKFVPKPVPCYRIKRMGVNGSDILVTGEHYIWDNIIGKNVKVKDYKNCSTECAVDESVKCDYFSCLITSRGTIPIGQCLFLDWEDTFMKDR